MSSIRHDLFPSPVVQIQGEFDLNSIEEEKNEIENIIKEGMRSNYVDESTNKFSIDRLILSRLHKLNKFIEEHINIYVNTIINPKEKLEFYITQSWLNETKPNQRHHVHWHSNSILSGVFYVKCVEEDKIYFHDPNIKSKEIISIAQKEYTPWNSPSWFIPIETNDLVIFPSWLEHSVSKNINATGDRLSISFNTFVKGMLGDPDSANELIL